LVHCTTSALVVQQLLQLVLLHSLLATQTHTNLPQGILQSEKGPSGPFYLSMYS